MTKKKTIITIVAVVALFAIVAIVYLILNKSDGQGDKVPQITSGTTPVTTVKAEVTTPVTTYEPFVNGLSVKAQEAYQSNSDTVGWIRISNTVIDYPIVRAADNEFYIDHNFNKEPADAGWIFMDYRCDYNEKVSTDNILLYGHNMADGSMFSDIKNYQRSESFYEENPIVEVSSLSADYQYKIFAFMLCNGIHGSDFEFWNYINFSRSTKDPAWTIDEYLSKINDKSLITTNVDVKKDDEFLLLSTCNSGDTTDGTRFVVLARKVRPGEDPLEGTTGSVRR